MTSEPPSSRSDAADRRRHDYRTTLTIMRLQTQLLLRVATRLDNSVGEQFVQGLTRIEDGITTLLKQLDQQEQAE
jgi:hypothetical protein